MKSIDCMLERVTLRTIGFVLLPFVLFFTVIAGIIIPVVGVLLATPLWALNALFLAAPRSNTCSLLLGGAK